MDHVLTVGMVVWPLLAILGVLGFLAGLIFLLAIFANGFNH